MSSQPQHWRDIAIAHSEIISDAWEVTKAYSARLAEWVLFLCMIFNIVEILPEVHLPSAISSAVLATQAVTLDIAGFGLASMADHARRCGNTKAAKRAAVTGYSLITIMLITLGVVTVGMLWPETKDVIIVLEKLLILIRVLMTVIYGHVIHSVRVAAISPDTLVDTTHMATQNPPANTTINPPHSATSGGQKAASDPATTPPAITPHIPPVTTPGNPPNHPPLDTPNNTPNVATSGGQKPATNTPEPTTEKPPPARPKSRQKSAAQTTQEKIAMYRKKHPTATQIDIARALTISLRSVQRYDGKPVKEQARLHIVP